MKKRDRIRQAWKSYAQKVLKTYEQISSGPSQEDIFAIQGSEFVEYGCDTFCLDCEDILECEGYKEIHGEWERHQS